MKSIKEKNDSSTPSEQNMVKPKIHKSAKVSATPEFKHEFKPPPLISTPSQRLILPKLPSATSTHPVHKKLFTFINNSSPHENSSPGKRTKLQPNYAYEDNIDDDDICCNESTTILRQPQLTARPTILKPFTPNSKEGAFNSFL